MRIPRKVHWRTHVKNVEYFHLIQLSKFKDWSIRKTAKMLNRSLGGVSEDLRLSLALRIYPEIEEFTTRQRAIIYLKAKHRCSVYLCGEWTAFEITEILNSLKEELEGARQDKYENEGIIESEGIPGES